MKKSHPSSMRYWTELCSDVNWEDYHGMWCKKAKDGSYYVVQFNNLIDAGGKEFEDTPYEAQVKRIDLSELSDKEVKSALNSCGYVLKDGKVFEPYSGDFVCGEDNQPTELILVEACIQYGLGAPIWDETSKNYPTRLRAQARRYAESCMKDADLLEERLERTVNAIGSTAREYGRGDINSALFRVDDNSSLEAKLVRKISFGV